MRKASFSVEKVSSHTIAHNTREDAPKYLIGLKEGRENLYKEFYSYDEFQELAEARYMEVNKQKMQTSQKENLFEEALISLEEYHTEEDVLSLFIALRKKYTGHTLINLAIHNDEGHFVRDGIEYYPTKHILQKEDSWYILDENDTEILEALKDKDFKPKAEDFKVKVDINTFEKVYNYHAHAVFSRFDLETGKNARFQKSTMSERYKFVAEQMKMKYAPDENRLVKKSIHQHKADLSAIRNAKLVIKKELEVEHSKELSEVKKEISTLKGQVTKNKNEKQKLKEELEKLKDESKDLRAELQLNKAEREAYQQLDYLNKNLQDQLKTGRKNFGEALKELEDLREQLLKKDEVIQDLEEVKKDNEYLKSSIEIKEIDILNLKSSNKSLEELKEVLEHKVTNLEKKTAYSPNMKEYEAIKDNLELQKEDKKTFFQKAVIKIKEMAQTIKEQAREILVLKNENFELKEKLKAQKNSNLSLEDRLELIEIKNAVTKSEAPKQQKKETKDHLAQLIEKEEASTGDKSDSSNLEKFKEVQEEEKSSKKKKNYLSR